MMLRNLLPMLCPCVLLVCCDKPGSSDTNKGDDLPAPPGPRGGHAPRELSPGSPAALRMILQTADRIQAPAAREKALADVAWSALEVDPELASEAFLKLPAGSTEKIRLIQHYAMRLAELGPDAALEWAATLETEQEISAAHSQIALVVAETDPQRAANLLSESGVFGREFDVAVVQVLQRWAIQSPSDAAAWTIMFPPGPAREAGIKTIATQWLPRDAPAAFGWMAALDGAEVRKEAALALEETLLQQPKDIRDAWLQHADAQLQSELEQQREQAIRNIGDNIPPTAP